MGEGNWFIDGTVKVLLVNGVEKVVEDSSFFSWVVDHLRVV